MSYPSAFKTPKGEARFLAAYDAAMKLWPVPYQEIDVPSWFGTTYVVASGPETAPPLVLHEGKSMHLPAFHTEERNRTRILPEALRR